MFEFRQKIESPKLRKFKGKLCTFQVQNVWMCGKIEYPEQQKLNRKLCTLYIYGMSGLAKKLNVQNCVNSIGKCTLYVRNVSSCRKFKYQELRKFNSIFST